MIGMMDLNGVEFDFLCAGQRVMPSALRSFSLPLETAMLLDGIRATRGLGERKPKAKGGHLRMPLLKIDSRLEDANREPVPAHSLPVQL